MGTTCCNREGGREAQVFIHGNVPHQQSGKANLWQEYKEELEILSTWQSHYRVRSFVYRPDEKVLEEKNVFQRPDRKCKQSHTSADNEKNKRPQTTLDKQHPNSLQINERAENEDASSQEDVGAVRKLEKSRSSSQNRNHAGEKLVNSKYTHVKSRYLKQNPKGVIKGNSKIRQVQAGRKATVRKPGFPESGQGPVKTSGAKGEQKQRRSVNHTHQALPRHSSLKAKDIGLEVTLESTLPKENRKIREETENSVALQLPTGRNATTDKKKFIHRRICSTIQESRKKQETHPQTNTVLSSSPKRLQLRLSDLIAKADFLQCTNT